MLYSRVQTQFPFALPDIDAATSAFIKESYPLGEAQRLVRMSRTGFFRFRGEHGIGVATGRKVNGAEIVCGLERARGLPGKGPFLSLRDYAAKLMTREEVGLHFGFKVTSLYKLRVRHRVLLLPGGIFHCDDIIAALEAERRGELPQSLSRRMPQPRATSEPDRSPRGHRRLPPGLQLLPPAQFPRLPIAAGLRGTTQSFNPSLRPAYGLPPRGITNSILLSHINPPPGLTLTPVPIPRPCQNAAHR